MADISLFGAERTMSSREIADLTGKEHKNVLADIRRMLEDLGKAAADFSATAQIAGPNGSTRTIEVFNLPKRECLILVSGYSVTMRARIIDRWQELEAAAAAPAPATELSRLDILKLAMASEEARLKAEAQIQRDAPKVAVVDYFLSVERGQDTNTVAKELAKVFVIGRTRLMEFLREHQVLNASNEPYQRHIDAGRFYMQPTTYRAKGETRASSSLRITPKGEFYIRELLQRHGCPLRKAPAA